METMSNHSTQALNANITVTGMEPLTPVNGNVAVTGPHQLTTVKLQWTHMEIGFMTMMATISFLCNSLVFLAYGRRRMNNKRMQKSTKFVLNLSICNSVITTVVIPIVITSTYRNQWTFSMSLCKMFSFSTVMVIGSSSLTLLCIAGDRYYAILDPLHHAVKFSNKKTFIYLTSVWAIAVIFSLLQFLLKSKVSYNTSLRMCFIDLSDNTSIYSVAYIYTFSFLFFFFPLSLMVFIYISIFQTLKVATATVRKYRSSKKRSSKHCQMEEMDSFNSKNSAAINYTSNHNGKDSYATTMADSSSTQQVKCYPHRDNRKGACMIFSSIFSFLICWGPFFTVVLLKVSFSMELPERLQSPPVYLLFAWCILNPIVYVFRNGRSKRRHRLMLRQQQRRNKNYYYNLLQEGDKNKLLEQVKEEVLEKEEENGHDAEDNEFRAKDQLVFIEKVGHPFSSYNNFLEICNTEGDWLKNKEKHKKAVIDKQFEVCTKYGLKPVPFTGSFYSC